MLWAKALIAVVVFLVGLVIFISCSRLLGPLRRLTLIFSFTLQTCLLLAAALLVQQEAVSPRSGQQEPIDWLQVLAISMIAFQAAGQLVASRFLAFSEIPTVVLTALVCDLLLDKQLYQRPWSANPKRNRRIGALVAHFFGAMAAGGMAKETGLAGGLWLAMAIKGGITVVWFGWSAKPMQLEKQ
ncbi:hypothetical protein BDV59DRAFT_185344 [Aspergillus ambiguus]|uniref:YoaK family protein n=1 Tax=Aspergillus ambiguus TaxID=176160 RepID=UPI003CCDC5EC